MEEETSEVKWWERLRRLSWLPAIGAVCFLIVYFVTTLPSGIPILLSTIGSTVFVVWILAGTVDVWLKKAILRDVFKATVGYLLPPELKPEMEWVYKQDIIAIKHRQSCKLTPLENDLVVLRVTINRTFQNVSQHMAKMKPTLAIDEWFHKERQSQILEFGYTGSNGKNFGCKRRDYTLNIEDREEKEVELPPRATFDTWFTYEEVKHINDEHFITFIYPTHSPFVEVEAFEGINIMVGFAMHKQHSLKTVGMNKYELTGTLLPGQQINIRWYRERESQEWLKLDEPKTTKG